MADATKIEWARHPITGKGATWNIVTGCRIVSPGCADCYAMRLAGTRLKNHPSRAGLTTMTKAGPVWNGEIRFNEQWLMQPLQWRDPRGIFVCAHGDLFAEGVTDDMLDRIFAVMAICRDHLFFVLTKRPQRMLDYLKADAVVARWSAALVKVRDNPWDEVFASRPLTNVMLGTSVEDQKRADERIGPMMSLSVRSWRTFVSYEPALGPVDWTNWGFLNWLISGGESGSRPSHPDWHRRARDFCKEFEIPYFFKQWGNWHPAPWKPERILGETTEAYKERCDDTAATHAIKAFDGYVHQMDHQAWSVGRGAIEPDGWAGIRRSDKATAGHLLDGVEHFEFPEVAL